MPRPRLVSLLLAVVIALTLGACGGDDGSDMGDREQIINAITEDATSSDPEKCTAFNTQRLLEQVSGLKGEAAIKDCERFAGLGPSEAVEVSIISLHGNSATAEVAHTGSELDGQTLALKLVKEGGQWKINRLAEFVSFDRKAWNAAIAETFSELFQPPYANCLRSGAERLSDDEVQDFYVGEPKRFNRVINTCLAQEARP